MTEKSIMLDDLKTGFIDGTNAAYGRQIVKLAEWADIQKAANEKTKILNDAIAEQHKRLMLLNAEAIKDPTARARDILSINTFGKHYDELDKNGANRGKIDKAAGDQVLADSISKQTAATEAARQALKGLLGDLQQEINLYGSKTRLQRVNYELQKAEYDSLDTQTKDRVRKLARILDDKDLHESLKNFNKEYAKSWQEMFDMMDEVEQKSLEPFMSAMSDLNNRMAATWDKSAQRARQLIILTNQFGGGSEGAERAKKYMDRLFDVERAEAFRKEIESLKSTLQNGLMNAAEDLWKNGFQNLFGRIITGFRKLLADMVKEWLQSKLTSMFMKLANNAFAMPSGGGGGVNTNDGFGGATYGIRDTKLKSTPAGSMTSAPKSQQSNGVSVVVNVQTQDVGSFMRSKAQVEAAMVASAQRALVRSR
jgi:hypothetical protein